MTMNDGVEGFIITIAINTALALVFLMIFGCLKDNQDDLFYRLHYNKKKHQADAKDDETALVAQNRKYEIRSKEMREELKKDDGILLPEGMFGWISYVYNIEEEDKLKDKYVSVWP